MMVLVEELGLVLSRNHLDPQVRKDLDDVVKRIEEHHEELGQALRADLVAAGRLGPIQ